MLDIVREGQVSFSAEQVADRAEVGLRTVFRHFQDMDTLYREMSGVIKLELQAVAEKPFASKAWQDRIVEIVERRSTAFERIAPYKRASEAFKHRSAFLQADGADFAVALRSILAQALPSEIEDHRQKLEVLDLLLSFEAWSRLRIEQNLSPERARDVLQTAVRAVIR